MRKKLRCNHFLDFFLNHFGAVNFFFDGFLDVLSSDELGVFLLRVEVGFACDVGDFGESGGQLHLVICESAAVLDEFG